MKIELTEQQRQAVAQAIEAPPVVVDPISQATYVLLRTDVYERLRILMEQDEELSVVREMYPHIWEVMKADWEDPAMRVYDDGASK